MGYGTHRHPCQQPIGETSHTHEPYQAKSLEKTPHDKKTILLTKKTFDVQSRSRYAHIGLGMCLGKKKPQTADLEPFGLGSLDGLCTFIAQ